MIKLQKVVLRDVVILTGGATKNIDLGDQRHRKAISSLEFHEDTGTVVMRTTAWCKLTKGKAGVARFGPGAWVCVVDAEPEAKGPKPNTGVIVQKD